MTKQNAIYSTFWHFNAHQSCGEKLIITRIIHFAWQLVTRTKSMLEFTSGSMSSCMPSVSEGKKSRSTAQAWSSFKVLFPPLVQLKVNEGL